MGVLDDLRRAREDYERGDLGAALAAWSSADLDALEPESLVDLADAAFLLGDRESAQARRCARVRPAPRRGRPSAGAVRCAFYLAMRAGTGGDAGPGRRLGGPRAAAILDASTRTSAERGYLAFLRMYGHIMGGDFEGAGRLAAEAEALGREHGDPELLALGLVRGRPGRALRGSGAEAMAAFDEAMLNLADPRSRR